MDEDVRYRGLGRPIDPALPEGGFPAGVIPTPDLLAQYNAIVPGAAERILQLAEEQTKYRYQLEKAHLAAEETKAYVVMGVGAAVAALCLAFGFIVILSGSTPAGIVLAIMGAALLVGALLQATRHRGSQARRHPRQPPLVREVQAFDL